MKMPYSDLRPPPPGCFVRVIALVCLIVSACTLCSCELLWGAAYHHQGGFGKRYRAQQTVPPDEAASNLQWFRDRYYDGPLTRKLNEPHAPSLCVAADQLERLTFEPEARTDAD